MAVSDRLAAQLADPAIVLDDEVHRVERVVKKADAERVALAAINGSMLRPADIATSTIDEIMLAWVPIWRIDLSTRGFHLGLSRVNGVTLPTGGTGHREAIKLVLARRLFAIDPTPKLKLEPTHLVPCGAKRPPGGECVQPDIDRDEAERLAKDAMRNSVEPSHALFSKIETEIRSVALVYYPLMVVRYRYAGEAKADLAPQQCHVAVSGQTGKILSEVHPSAFRAIGARIKNLFG